MPNKKSKSHKKTAPKSKKTLSPKHKNSHLVALLVISLIILIGGFYLLHVIASKYTQSQYIQTKVYQFTPKDLPETGSSSATPKVASISAVLPQKAVLPAATGNSVRVPILTYHYIGNNPNPADTARDNLEITPDKFQDEMQYLSTNKYNAISLDTLFNALDNHGALPSKPIILTFDDGYIDFYLNAFPILERFNLHATAFIPTGLIGKPAYMTWDQIKEIQGSGLISFQAHSINHPDLTKVSLDQAKNEIIQSKKTLESFLGMPVNFFAYPYGASNAQTWQLVKDAGFIGAVGTWSGNEENIGLAYDLPRIKIAGAISLSDFTTKL